MTLCHATVTKYSNELTNCVKTEHQNRSDQRKLLFLHYKNKICEMSGSHSK